MGSGCPLHVCSLFNALRLLLFYLADATPLQPGAARLLKCLRPALAEKNNTGVIVGSILGAFVAAGEYRALVMHTMGSSFTQLLHAVMHLDVATTTWCG